MSFTNYDKGRPGVFFTFAEIAQERLAPVDGFVAILSTEYATPATAGNTYLFESRKAAADGLGATSEAYKTVKRAFDGGATRAVVRTLPATPLVTDYEAAQAALLTEFFEAVAFDHIPDTAALASMVAWVQEQREENENYTFLVLGGDATRDADPDLGVAAALLHQDEFIVNLVNAPKYADETLTSAQQAAKVAGQLASLSLADSLTYTTISIHAPARGAITLRLTTFTAYSDISIHAPARGAIPTVTAITERSHISIHAPARGAIACHRNG